MLARRPAIPPGVKVALDEILAPDRGIATDVLRVVGELQADADVVGEPAPCASSTPKTRSTMRPTGAAESRQ